MRYSRILTALSVVTGMWYVHMFPGRVSCPPISHSTSSRSDDEEELHGEKRGDRDGSWKAESGRAESLPEVPHHTQTVQEDPQYDSDVEYCSHGLYNVTSVLFIT